MKFHIVALSLPRDDVYMTIHKHEKPEHCVWKESDRVAFEHFRNIVHQLYEQGPSGLPINRIALEALYKEGLTAQEAVNRVIPYYITCMSLNQRRIEFPQTRINEVEIVGPAGTEQEEHGCRLVAIAKGAERLRLKPWVLDKVSEMRETPFTEEEAQTLEGRSDRTLIRVVSRSEEPCTEEGTLKIVSIPKEVSVRLSRTARGEFVSEIPRVWS